MSVCHQAIHASVTVAKDKPAEHYPRMQAGETRSSELLPWPGPTGRTESMREGSLATWRGSQAAWHPPVQECLLFPGRCRTSGSYGGLWQPLPKKPTSDPSGRVTWSTWAQADVPFISAHPPDSALYIPGLRKLQKSYCSSRRPCTSPGNLVRTW